MQRRIKETRKASRASVIWFKKIIMFLQKQVVVHSQDYLLVQL